MGPRIYPSYQDTNTTAKGSLILSLDDTIDDVNVYVNNNLVNKQYSIVNGIYSVSLNVNDVVRLERGDIIKISSIRKDYTTDDQSGNNGIIDTFITGITSTNSYTFTATTSPSSYNFEYLISVKLGGARASLIVTYNTTISNNIGALIGVKNIVAYGLPVGQSSPNLFTFFIDDFEFSGTTSRSFNLGEFPLTGSTNVTMDGILKSEVCYITRNGFVINGIPDCYFKTYVNGVLQNTSTYGGASPGFGIITSCSGYVVPISPSNIFTCSDGDIVEWVFDDNFTIQNYTPTPTPIPTPTPTPIPVNITLQRRYIGSGGSTGSTKTVESTIVTSGVTYTYSGLTWTTSIDDTESKSVTTTSVNPTFSFTRRICKTGSTQVLNLRDFKLYINGNLEQGATYPISVTITTCSTYVTQTINFEYIGTISSGDVVQCYLQDTI
jgi:hypothetical protein